MLMGNNNLIRTTIASNIGLVLFLSIFILLQVLDRDVYRQALAMALWFIGYPALILSTFFGLKSLLSLRAEKFDIPKGKFFLFMILNLGGIIFCIYFLFRVFLILLD